MHKKKRTFGQFGVLVGMFLALCYLVIFVQPETAFSVGNGVSVTTTGIFFLLLFSFLFLLILSLFRNRLQAILIASFLLFYLLLRYFHFTHFFFLILLIAIFVTLELVFYKNK